MARAARSLDTLLAQLNAAFPGRSKASDGWIGDAAHQLRASDHNPDRYGIVHARDYTHDPKAGLIIAELAMQLSLSGDNRIKYIIANALYWDPKAPNWARYKGSNPHTKHLHLSVLSGVGDDPRPWDLPMFREEEGMAADFDSKRVDKFGNSHTYGVAMDWTEYRVARLDGEDPDSAAKRKDVGYARDQVLDALDGVIATVATIAGEIAEIKAKLDGEAA